MLTKKVTAKAAFEEKNSKRIACTFHGIFVSLHRILKQLNL
jgi:hypothetical protein